LFGLLVLLAGVILPWPRSQQARAQAGRPVVHVFLQLDAKSGAVEKLLQGRLPGLVVTAFGRFRDFDDAANARRPDAVVSIPPVLESRGAKPVLQGTRGGKATEAYVLASVGQPLGGSLAGKTIGVVDLLSREGTQAFITGSSRPPTSRSSAWRRSRICCHCLSSRPPTASCFPTPCWPSSWSARACR